MPDTCQHREIQAYFFADTGLPAGLWACKTCGLKFAPEASSRAAALEEAAQIADAEAARLKQAALQADPDDVSAIRSTAWVLENIAWKIRERAKT